MPRHLKSKERLKERRESVPYQLFMLTLCITALVGLAIQSVVPLTADVRLVLQHADTAICVFFLADFLLCFASEEKRWRYLVTWGWLDLASSIPTIDVARWGRAARAARIFRVLRGVRATKSIAALLLRKRAEATVLAAGLVALLLIVVASISVLHFETAPEANIKSAEDALWWAFATIATVGYGDKFPVTTEGRVVAGVLMVAGVGLFGTFAAFLASWFIEERDEIGEVKKELAEIRKMLEKMERKHAV